MVIETLEMEKDTYVVDLNFGIEDNSTASGNPEDHDEIDHINTDPEETNENHQIDEKDLLVFLREALDEKSLLEKIYYIRSEWSHKDDSFEKSSKKVFAFKVFLWVLRYV